MRNVLIYIRGRKEGVCQEWLDMILGSCFYHVIVQGINKENIFKNDEFIREYKKIVIYKLKDSNVTILAYCIMNNHAHFLIYAEKIEYLGKYMQRINTSYSNFYNKKQNRIGYVFRDRYKSQSILSERQLYNCLVYIHKNPLKAGIVSKLEDYKYSSYNEFKTNRIIINEQSINLLFGNNKDYKDLFYFLHNQDTEEKFIDIKDKDITEIIKEYEEKYNLSVEYFRRKREIMKEFIINAREKTDVTLVELANILDISKSTVAVYDKK